MNMKVKIEDPHTNYYSSDDHFSDSGELSPLQVVTSMNMEATFKGPAHSGTHHGLSNSNSTCRKML